jgi:hypothetical protein
MDYLDTGINSIFTLTFFDGVTNVGSAAFTTGAPFNTVNFVGFISDTAFDRITVRENDGSNNTDEFFQFYSATEAAPVPEPSSMLVLGLGIVGLGLLRRYKFKSP